jgi:hypothetical protein
MLILSKSLYLSCAGGCQFRGDHTKLFFDRLRMPAGGRSLPSTLQSLVGSD